MDGAKLFLTVVGVAYWALAAWCALKPEQTSNAIGLQLKPGAGQSEYFTVYGGLQLGLGLLFLWPWVQSDSLDFALLACLIIHAGLVLMRSLAFVLYSGIPPMTIGFALSEWLILGGSVLFWFLRRTP